MFINGIGISGYRSFGSSIQYIRPFSKVNLIIGENNSGKSNILLFLENHFKNTIRSLSNQDEKINFLPIDKPVISHSQDIIVSFPIFPNSNSYNSILSKCHELGMNSELLKKILGSKIFVNETELPWLNLKGTWDENIHLMIPEEYKSQIYEENILTNDEWVSFSDKIIRRETSNIRRHCIPKTLESKEGLSPQLAAQQ